MTETLEEQLLDECKRQEENALYTSTGLHIWLRELRLRKTCFLIFQLALAGLAAYFAVTGQAIYAGIFGAIAGISPSVWDALKLDEGLDTATRSAAEYTAMRDTFRQARTIGRSKGIEEFEKAFNEAMGQMNSLRKVSLTPPERIFNQAQKKISSGDYQHAVDTKQGCS